MRRQKVKTLSPKLWTVHHEPSDSRDERHGRTRSDALVQCVGSRWCNVWGQDGFRVQTSLMNILINDVP